MREDMLCEVNNQIKRCMATLEDAMTTLSRAANATDEVAYSQYFSQEEQRRLQQALEIMMKCRSKVKTLNDQLGEAGRIVSRIEY